MDRFKAAERRKGIRGRAIAYKGGRCFVCGYDACPQAFDFHHPDPLQKDFTISRRMTSFEAIRPELDKCILLCANCHREVHAGMHPALIEDPDSWRGMLDADIEEDAEAV